MTTVVHRRFDLGFNQDEASFLLDEGYVYSAKNMLFDKLGVARKRGGIIGLGSDAVSGFTYTGDQIAGLQSETSALYGFQYGTSPNVVYINRTTGAMTSMGTPTMGDFFNQATGRPFSHYGFLMIPQMSTTIAGIGAIVVGGATGAKTPFTFATPASVVVTAGDKRIPCAAGDSPTTKMEIGQIILIFNAGVTHCYIGRVTKLISTTAFEVFPTPTASFTAGSVSANNCVGMVSAAMTNASAFIGGKVGMSYQGRAVLANISRNYVAVGNRVETYPRRVHFSALMIEQDAAQKTPTYQGAVWVGMNGFPDFNYFDVPGTDGDLTAISQTGFGDAVAFSANRAHRITGNLSTQYGTSTSVTWAVREIPNSVGCMSERSLQRTPKGIIYAHTSGIYATDGASIQPLMTGKVSKYWKALVAAGGSAFSITGSALVYGNHYYINGFAGPSATGEFGLLLNLDTLAWTTITGKANPFLNTCSWFINSACQDPDDPSRTWALKYWDTINGSSSFIAGTTFKNGQLLKLESMFSPVTATKADNDGTTVNFEIVTRPYAEEAVTRQKVWQQATIEYANKGGANVAVTPLTFLDAANIPAGGTSYFLPRQDVYTITAATNASPIVVTCGAHDIKVDSWVMISGVLGNLGANGPFRVQAVTATTVTLVGSVGTGAWTSGGTIRNVDARDIGLEGIAIVPGGDPAAIVYRINDTDAGGTAGADSFELQGIMHSYEARDAHVE